MNTARRSRKREPAIGGARRPRRFWPRALPSLVRHLARSMPWATLVAGCLAGIAVLAVLAHVAETSHSPLDQNDVRLVFLPAVAALAFVAHVPFRPVTHTTPVPAWMTSAGQVVLALPLLAATGWAQLGIMAGAVPPGSASRPAAIYPLLAQLTGWCALSVAAAACCERSRYVDLGGAVAAPVVLATIALTWFTPGVKQVLAVPPAPAHTATVAWYITAGATSVVTCIAMGDHWRRGSRILHRR
jgi:hypothetical protein